MTARKDALDRISRATLEAANALGALSATIDQRDANDAGAWAAAIAIGKIIGSLERTLQLAAAIEQRDAEQRQRLAAATQELEEELLS